MSNLSFGNQKKEYRHLLVFDTIALLSANQKNRVQVWRNNEQLGECYIPGATYAEICQLAKNSSKPQDQDSAKAFLDFATKGGRYKIQPIEDNIIIPLDDEKDRQILACACNLASKNPNCVVILVTYDRSIKGLVRQAGLPNFCHLTAKELSNWFNEDYYRNRVPQAVSDTYRRIKQSSTSSFKPGDGHNDNRRNHLPGKQQPQPRRIEQAPEPRTPDGTPKPKINNQSRSDNTYSNRDFPPQPIPDSPIPTSTSKTNRSFIPWVVGIGAACVVLGGLLGTGIFTGSNSAIVAQEVVDNQPVQPTPPELITQAEAAILEFQKTKEPSSLKEPLNALQTLKNQQGVRLDEQGEQRLSRLKHKYAIEVLASSGQRAEAFKMLKEVSSNYSEIGDVKKWLAKYQG